MKDFGGAGLGFDFLDDIFGDFFKGDGTIGLSIKRKASTNSKKWRVSTFWPSPNPFSRHRPIIGFCEACYRNSRFGHFA